MTSQRKINANRKNGKKGRGPKTEEGKRKVSRNSRTHGLWTRELSWTTDDEKEELDLLVSDLKSTLHPNGPILHYYFDEIVLCMWRLKKLVKFENAQFTSLTPDAAEPEFASLPPGVLAPQSLKAITQQLAILKDLHKRVADNPGSLVEEERLLIKEYFGESFLEQLETWLASPRENIVELMRRMVEDKSKRFALPDILGIESGASGRNTSDATEASPDRSIPPPDLTPEGTELNKIRLYVKHAVLLEILGARIQQLEAIYARYKSKNALATPDVLEMRVDLQLRYSSALKRDLRKAIDSYFFYRSTLANSRK